MLSFTTLALPRLLLASVLARTQLVERSALQPSCIMPDNGVSEVQTAEDGTQFMVFRPSSWSEEAVAAGKKWPVLLFLHGAGGVKNPDNVRGQSLTRMLLNPEYVQANAVEHIVLMPVAPARDWNKHFERVMALVSMSIAELGGDQSRVALAGQSMGGNGAWMLAAQHPQTFCAVVVVCGYIDRDDTQSVPASLVAALKPKPVWVFHAADDTVVAVEHSDAAVAALKAAGASDIRYTRYEPGLAPPCKTPAKDLPGHASYELAFADAALWPWLREQRLQ